MNRIFGKHSINNPFFIYIVISKLLQFIKNFMFHYGFFVDTCVVDTYAVWTTYGICTTIIGTKSNNNSDSETYVMYLMRGNKYRSLMFPLFVLNFSV